MDENQIEITYTPSAGENLSRAGLTEAQNIALNRRLKYVEAVMDSTDQFGSQRQIKPIVKMVAKEINDDSPPGVSTVAGWVRKYVRGGCNDLALMPRLKPTRMRSKLQVELQEIISKAVEKVYMNRQKNPISAVLPEVTFMVAEYNRNAAIPLPFPSRETIRRYIQKIDRYQLDVKRHGKAYANRQHRAPGRAFHTTEPLELVQADGQIMDIIIVEKDEDGNPGQDIGRPYITVFFDVHTRCVLYALITLAPFCGATLLGTLGKACVANGSKPRGIPHKLLVDNGADYRDNGFLEAATRLGILVEPCPPYTPNAKPHVERFFRTLNEDLVHKLPGTTFSNPAHRGDYASQELARYTLDELRAEVDTWITHVYHVRSHSSLLRTPFDVWRTETKEKPIRTLSAEDAEVMIRSAEKRTVTQGCVQAHSLIWRSDALRSWEVEQRAMRRKPEVEVMIDELDLSYVFVRALDGSLAEWIKAHSRTPHYTKDLSLYEHRLLKAELKALDIAERFEQLKDVELTQLRLEYYASLGHADDKVARARRDRLRDALAEHERMSEQQHTVSKGSISDGVKHQSVNDASEKSPHITNMEEQYSVDSPPDSNKQSEQKDRSFQEDKEAENDSTIEDMPKPRFGSRISTRRPR